ncbi:MAG: hypothetical protein KKD99_08570, partial [Proteobacteria bacterium]|nr:hypothetical protein [Pseudomonadota bacterium]
MTVEGKPPDFYELIKKWIFDHFGIPGLAVLAFLAIAFYAYKNWDKIKTWPGVASVVTNISRWPVPKADPNRFAVLVAHLENDTQRE